MKFAMYAGVSTEKQEREQTIESQLAALLQRASEKGYEIDASTSMPRSLAATDSIDRNWTRFAITPVTVSSKASRRSPNRCGAAEVRAKTFTYATRPTPSGGSPGAGSPA